MPFLRFLRCGGMGYSKLSYDEYIDNIALETIKR